MRRATWLAVLGGWAGLAAPALLALVFAALTLVERHYLSGIGWSPLRRTAVQWPSVLALGPYGWVETVALVACGLLGLCFAAALYAEMPTRVSRAGAVFIGVIAVAVVLTAFRADPPGAGTAASWHDRVHNGVYPLIPLGSVAAAVCLAAGLRGDRRWRAAATLSLLAVCSFIVALGLSYVDEIAQLARYFFFGPLFAWVALFARRLIEVSREGARRTVPPAQRYEGSRGSTN
jgi:Protein of unknown function (DUF998)